MPGSSGVVQARTDSEGGEVSAAQLWETFQDEYLPATGAGWGRFALVSMRSDSTVDGADRISVTLTDHGQERTIEGVGNGPIAAFVDALQRECDIELTVVDYREHAIGAGADAQATAYVQIRDPGDTTLYGVGIDGNIVTASLKAVASAATRVSQPTGRQ